MVLFVKYGLANLAKATLTTLIILISVTLPILSIIPFMVIRILGKKLYNFLLNNYIEISMNFVEFLYYYIDACNKYTDDYKKIRKECNKFVNIYIKNNFFIHKYNEKKEIKSFELVLSNINELKEYYILSKTMAKKSFIFAVWMGIFGSMIITSSVFILLLTNIPFLEKLIPLISGSIIEIISGTALFIYKKSIKQLNKYYDSLHTDELYLLSLDIVDKKISFDKKDETYLYIIDQMLKK